MAECVDMNTTTIVRLLNERRIVTNLARYGSTVHTITVMLWPIVYCATGHRVNIMTNGIYGSLLLLYAGLFLYGRRFRYKSKAIIDAVSTASAPEILQLSCYLIYDIHSVAIAELFSRGTFDNIIEIHGVVPLLERVFLHNWVVNTSPGSAQKSVMHVITRTDDGTPVTGQEYLVALADLIPGVTPNNEIQSMIALLKRTVRKFTRNCVPEPVVDALHEAIEKLQNRSRNDCPATVLLRPTKAHHENKTLLRAVGVEESAVCLPSEELSATRN
jgi:hypothetical protein